MKNTYLLTGIVLALFAITLNVASAHESRSYEIKGSTYEFVVGSLDEPVVMGDKTGVDFSVTKNGTPLAGLETTLKVDVRIGDDTRTSAFSTVYGSVGKYKTTFYPTETSPLSYRIYGDLEGTPIDFVFECNAMGHAMHSVVDTTRTQITNDIVLVKKMGAFGCVAPLSDYEFPAKGSMRGQANGLFIALLALLISLVVLFKKDGDHKMFKIVAVILVVLIALGFVYRSVARKQMTQPAAPAMDSMNMTSDMMENHNHTLREIGASSALPEISVVVAPDAVDGYNLHLVTKNFTFTPENVGDEAKENQGHAHLYVNGVKIARVYSNWYNLSAKYLKSGANEIRVTLNANDHEEWAHDGKTIAATVMITK